MLPCQPPPAPPPAVKLGMASRSTIPLWVGELKNPSAQTSDALIGHPSPLLGEAGLLVLPVLLSMISAFLLHTSELGTRVPQVHQSTRLCVGGFHASWLIAGPRPALGAGRHGTSRVSGGSWAAVGGVEVLRVLRREDGFLNVKGGPHARADAAPVVLATKAEERDRHRRCVPVVEA